MKRVTISALFVLVALTVVACGPAQAITDPVEVLQAFYDALNEEDVDGAMEYVAEVEDTSFVFEVRLSSKADIRDFYQREADRHARYELSDIQVEGDTVTFTLCQTSDILSESSHSHVAVIEGGKIVKHLRM